MISRRDLLKYGIATATLSGLSSGPAAADGGVGVSAIRTEPFVDRLPLASVKTPVSVLSHPARFTNAGPGNHQFYSNFLPQKLYEIHVKENSYHSFNRAIGPVSKVWGYDGVFPGPIFHAKYGEPIMVRFFNELPKNHVGFGMPSLATHLHNGHTASESDGYPGNFQDSYTYWDNHYPNTLNGFTDAHGNFVGGSGDRREGMGTLWYHDHRQDFTAQNVYAGLAGGYLLFDDLDCNNENDGNGFRLPSGEYDVTLAFGDKVIDANGQLVYDFFNLDGILGDKNTVNGKIQPFFDVEPRKYRFRLLDGGPSRFYAFALSDGTPLIQISNDGNLMAAPVQRPYVTCGVAERHDVIIDFSKYKAGTKLYLLNRAEQTGGRGPTGKLLTPGDPLLEFRVTSYNAPDLSQVRNVLRVPPPIDLTGPITYRRFEFDRSGGGWTVNGRVFDEGRSDAQVKRNSREVWTLKNGGGGWSHPIHIHMEEFRILKRNGRTPADFEAGRKDVAVLGPGDECDVLFNFRDWLGKYVMHCHNVVHEDHSMMVRFDLVP